MKRYVRVCLALLLLATGVAIACGSDDAEPGAVHVLKTDGTVGPIMTRYIDRGIDRAENNDAVLVVIELDTPGGLTSSMRDIVRRIETANVPVAVYVSPIGGRAASAGTFITMAANLAVMAPNTSIGAASVINSDGSDLDDTLGKKVTNDMAAFARGVAELRGRNVEWAEDAVREAISATQSEAVELNVVDYVATDLADLLAQAEGRTVTIGNGDEVTLGEMAAAPIVRTNMTWWEQVMEVVADPNIATILITLGFLALVFELANPGMIVPGVAGLVGIIVGFMAFDVLDVQTAGIALILVGLALLALELFLPSGGLLGIAAAVALVAGAFIAFQDAPTDVRPSPYLVGALVVFGAAFFVAMSISIIKLRSLSSPVGTDAMIGRLAIARTPLSPDGVVFFRGERWKATSEGSGVQAGDEVRIVAAEGLKLRVRKEEANDSTPDTKNK
ncbi:MAG: nodulation protein NfeD [Dehalococcoidia bacterium]